MKNTLKHKNRDYLEFSFWIFGAFILVIVNYISLNLIKSAIDSEVLGWTVLFGGPIFLLAFMMILFIIDAMYLIFFLRWLILGKNDREKNTVYLP